MCSDLVIKRVLNVEKRTDNATVSRYMLELELEDKQGKNMLLSKYFYATKDKNKGRNPKVPTLCSPNGFSWKPEATVHVILAGQNYVLCNNIAFNITFVHIKVW